MVIWLIGMSASGKTSIGERLYDKLQLSDDKWVFLDGDLFRSILGEDLGHTIEDRKKNAYRISRFCKYLNSQGVNVLACVLSIFHDNQKYNKDNIKNYKEVFIDVDLENLIRRDNKNLYKQALEKKINNVVGVDIDFHPPYSPDLTINNNPDNPNYDDMTELILNHFDIRIDNRYIYTNNKLLQEANTYQYSKFEGVDFFKKLIEDREEGDVFFNRRLKRLKCNTPLELEKKKYIKGNNLILEDYFSTLLQYNHDELISNTNIIDLLIKRFEVSKKLYLSYDINEIKKTSTNYTTLINYAFFSLVLQEYYKNSKTAKKFVYLNAVLKLNDIISSEKNDFILVSEVYFAGLAISGELEILKEYV